MALLISAVTQVVAAIVTAWAGARIRPNHELQSSLRALENDFNDLVDHVNRKETRERVRKMRDGREAANAQPADPQPGTPEFKAHLRSVAKSRGLLR